MGALEDVSTAELVQLAAIDDDLFARSFFPKTVRQATPPIHRAMDLVLARRPRYAAFEVFRGGAKTTKARLFSAKRIAYAMSHTIMFVSNSQDHAILSVDWLKRAVEFNTRFAQTYGLRKGSKWNSEEIEIIHGIDEFPIRVGAYGITGQVRGLNVDDYRPDLIVVDDPDNEETTATEAQRLKTSNLFFGALQKSLAPESEAPDALMLLLQTPLNRFDLVETCMRDPQWHGVRYGCFDNNGESVWPERFSTDFLMREKQAHINRNQLSLWMREMECRIISTETSSFRAEWLKYYDILPQGCWYLIAIDPASSTKPDADFFAIVVLAIFNGNIFVVEYQLARGVESDKAIAFVVDLTLKYRPRRIVCEAIGFQRTLAAGLRREQDKRRVYTPVREFQSQQRKSYRITQALSGISTYGHLFCKREHTDFIQQFISYSPLFEDHDDLIDAVAIGAADVAQELVIEGEAQRIEDEEYPALDWRRAP